LKLINKEKEIEKLISDIKEKILSCDVLLKNLEDKKEKEILELEQENLKNIKNETNNIIKSKTPRIKPKKKKIFSFSGLF
jgi:oligoendopeptidase F